MINTMSTIKLTANKLINDDFYGLNNVFAEDIEYIILNGRKIEPSH